MRNIWMVSMVVAAAGCGIASQPWDKNRDGLIAACEGLDRFSCSVSPGCEVQELACIALCVDDGKGGCGSPCPDDFACVPKKQPACEDLNPHQCTKDSRCELSPGACDLACRDDGNGGCLPCTAPSSCVTRGPAPQPSCALIPIGVCALVPACHVETLTVCTATTEAHPGPDPYPIEPGCGGGGGCTSTQVCVNTAPVSCESLSVSSCGSNPSCQLESGPTCKIACQPGSPCPPCATPVQRCVTRPAPTCSDLPIDQCSTEAGCMVEAYACPAVCEDDGKGGCLPCPAPASACVPLPVQLPTK